MSKSTSSPQSQNNRAQPSPGAQRTTTKRSSTLKPPILLWVALAGAAVVIGIMVVAGLPRDGGTAAEPVPTSTATDSATATLSDLARRSPVDVASQGAVDAPVVIVEYADYRCPYCAHFDRDTLPNLVSDYIDAGKVRFEWRDFPIFGDESFGAAVAARAAGEQGMFWEFHHAVYAAAPDRGHPDLPNERLVEIAQQVGVPDIDKFTADLTNPQLMAAVSADLSEGKALGVSSVPAFIVGNTPIIGAQPEAAFRQAIEAELAKADTGRTAK